MITPEPALAAVNVGFIAIHVQVLLFCIMHTTEVMNSSSQLRLKAVFQVAEMEKIKSKTVKCKYHALKNSYVMYGSERAFSGTGHEVLKES